MYLMLWKPFILDFKSGHKAPQRSFEKYNISAALKQPYQYAPRHGSELTELIGLNGLNAVENKVFFLLLCATVTNWAVPFRKKMKYFIF